VADPAAVVRSSMREQRNERRPDVVENARLRGGIRMDAVGLELREIFVEPLKAYGATDRWFAFATSANNETKRREYAGP